MDNTGANSTRLIKNSLFLYMRTLLIMLITLYTTRVVLKTLGVIDYGIYNVVGGWVVLMYSVSASMSGACSRFVSFAIGSQDKNLCNETFSTIRITIWIVALFFFLFGETVGTWFVSYKMQIPVERTTSAMIAFQCMLASSIFSTLVIPYNSLIIGYEKMDTYAYISIIESVLKLLIAIALPFIGYDHLIIYSVLMLFVSILVCPIYLIYGRLYFSETKAPVVWNKELFKKISSFAGWTLNGQLACMGYTQGINILLNLFFGPVVNAARGISVQVQGAAKILVNNFQVALRPQMIKVWAQGDVAFMHRLVIISSKFSFFLTSLTIFPLCWCISPILRIWLGEIPDHTVNFVRIILYTMLVESFCHGMIVSIHATGNIKKFQLWEGTASLTVVPIAYILLKLFCITPEVVMSVYLFVQICTQIIRMKIVLPEIHMTWYSYISGVFPRILIVFSLFLAPSFYLDFSFDTSILETFVFLVLSFLYVSIIILTIGLNGEEKKWVLVKVSSLISKIKK